MRPPEGPDLGTRPPNFGENLPSIPAGLSFRGEKDLRNADETNVHGDALCFLVMALSLLQRLAVGGWRLVAVGSRWRLAVGSGWRLAVGGPWGLSLTQKNLASSGQPWRDA